MKKYSKKIIVFLFNNKEALLEKLSWCDFRDFNDTKNMPAWDKTSYEKDIDTDLPGDFQTNVKRAVGYFLSLYSSKGVFTTHMCISAYDLFLQEHGALNGFVFRRLL